MGNSFKKQYSQFANNRNLYSADVDMQIEFMLPLKDLYLALGEKNPNIKAIYKDDIKGLLYNAYRLSLSIKDIDVNYIAKDELRVALSGVAPQLERDGYDTPSLALAYSICLAEKGLINIHECFNELYLYWNNIKAKERAYDVAVILLLAICKFGEWV